jgi:hypothetical protein
MMRPIFQIVTMNLYMVKLDLLLVTMDLQFVSLVLHVVMKPSFSLFASYYSDF